MLRDVELHVTWDTSAGRASAYVLDRTKDGQARWVADRDFSAWEGAWDVARWFARVTVHEAVLPGM